jgi:hypothetical protein
VHTHLPPKIDYDTGALYEQRDADYRHQEVGHVRDVEDMHEAEIAADIDDIRYDSFVSLPQLEGAPPMQAAVDEDA